MAIFTDLGALGAAFAGLIVILAAVPLLRRVITPGPMFNPEGFARLLVAEVQMQRRHGVEHRTLQADIDRARTVFLSRFPNDEAVFDAAVAAMSSRSG
jgi:hypothetical protein